MTIVPIRNLCEHAIEMQNKNAQIASMTKKGSIKLAHLDNEKVVMEINLVEYCPVCGVKFEFE